MRYISIIFKSEYLQYVKKGANTSITMVTINDLRVCKSCGNVFSKKAGVTIITECPQCKATNFEQITDSDDPVYLDEID